MSYVFYKNIHYLGIFMMLVAYGSLLSRLDGHSPMRRLAAMTHGLGAMISLIAGFGMLAKLGIHWPFPGWVVGKAVIWIALAVGIAPARRRPQMSGTLWWLVIGAAVLSSYLALNKPF